MCIGAEPLHICSFLISYYSGDVYLVDIETMLSYNQSKEIYYDMSLGKFDLYSFDGSYIEFHSQCLKIL